MILVVDDDPVFLEEATSVLRSETQQILGARNASSTMTLLQTMGDQVDVILIDLALGKNNGLELIAAVHKMDRELPIIAISGSASQAAFETAKILGATETLSKPLAEEWKVTIHRVRRKRA